MVIPCKKPCKKKKSTMLTVEQMVDIALGTPEIGAVNFNVLHALIHVIIQQLNIQKCLVEFKGYDSDRMEGIILSAKPGPILKLSEYMIDTADGKPCSGKEKTSKDKEITVDSEKKESSSVKKTSCECSGEQKRKKGVDEEKEKSDKGKDESNVEEMEVTEIKMKKDLAPGECEEIDLELESKKPLEVKKSDKPKSCACKSNKESEVPGDESQKLADDSPKPALSSYYGSDTEGPCQTIVRVEPVGDRCDSWRSRPALAHESMVKLEEKVAMLQDAFEALDQMPTNEELKKRTQGTGNPPTPVKDLWQLYNLNKRVESCEGTIEKLASMIEDLVKETCNYREAMLVIADAVDEIECADQSARNTCCAALQGSIGRGVAIGYNQPPATSKGSKTGLANFKLEGQSVTFSKCNGQPCTDENKPIDVESRRSSRVPDTEPRVSGASGPRVSIAAQSRVSGASGPRVSISSHPRVSISSQRRVSISTHPQDLEHLGDDPEEVPQVTEIQDSPGPRLRSSLADPERARASQPDVPPISAEVNTGIPAPPQQFGIGPEFYKMSASEKFCVLKENIDCLICQVRNVAENVPVNQMASKLCALASMQKQLEALDKEWKTFHKSLGEEGIDGLSNNIKNVHGDIDNLNNLISKVIAEKQDLEASIRNVLHEIETLKRVKADLEVVEDLLAEKADAALVNRKVSHDQFDAACDDLTKGLDEALDRLMEQEAMWHEAMEELQKDLENKLDKNEIMPLKEFINKKLKCLQEKLKQLVQLKKDAEAAGAKSRILRNLNCIACDGDVIMRMDNKSSSQCPTMPASKTIKPLLTYELDQVRKALKKGVPCRGVNHVEEAILDVQKKAVGIPLTTREAVDHKISKLAHFCNRYCGGSHTITTPQQRVTRIGHFLTEFGPQAMALFNQDNCADSKSVQQGSYPTGDITSDVDLRKPC